jgi:hypothetical protein
MTIEDIVALTKAGFSKDEIFALTGDPDQQEKKPADPQPEEKKPADPQPEEKKPADPKPSEIESINKRLDYLISRMNLAAVQNSQQPGSEKQETVDDILASVFKPKKKEEK